jgi:aldose 1-epimerase
MQHKLYRIASSKLEVDVIELGGRVCAIRCPDKNGEFGNVVLCPDPLISGNPFYGAIIGPVANRIEEGKFKIGNKEYLLPINNSPNHLHGGFSGFHNQYWKIEQTSPTQLILFYSRLHMQDGYPGNLYCSVTYTILDNSFVIEMEAKASEVTPVSLTHHCFFNLTGNATESILDHTLQLWANYFVPVNSHQIPIGTIASVENTPFDFRIPKSLGMDIFKVNEQLTLANGYDHHFVLSKEENNPINLAARVTDPLSGREMELYTNSPGVQVYTGNFLDGQDVGVGKVCFQKHSAFCLEPQKIPNAVNNTRFPSILLEPDKGYQQKMIYSFKTIKQ